MLAPAQKLAVGISLLDMLRVMKGVFRTWSLNMAVTRHRKQELGTARGRMLGHGAVLQPESVTICLIVELRLNSTGIQDRHRRDYVKRVMNLRISFHLLVGVLTANLVRDIIT